MMRPDPGTWRATQPAGFLSFFHSFTQSVIYIERERKEVRFIDLFLSGFGLHGTVTGEI